jgi:signal peptidase I
MNDPFTQLAEGHTEPETREEAAASWRTFLIDLLETVVLALVLYAAINFLTARVYVEGASMEPNFHNGNFVIVNRLAYQWSQPERGDVVVFPYPGNPDDDYIKRVLALPGDTFAVEGGIVYVNGVALDEPYINGPMRRDFPQLTIPPGTVFVLGDNRNDSSDSRSWGPLQIEDILGKAVLTYWPLSDLGGVQHLDLDVQVANGQ